MFDHLLGTPEVRTEIRQYRYGRISYAKVFLAMLAALIVFALIASASQPF